MESEYIISKSASLNPHTSPGEYLTYRKGLIVISLVLIIILGLSMVLPWYSQSTEFKFFNYKLDAEKTYSLSEINAKGNNNFFGANEISDETKTWDDEDINGLENTKKIYQETKFLVTVAFLLSFILFIFSIILFFGKGKFFVVIIGLILMIICIWIPVNFFINHCSAVTDDGGMNCGFEIEETIDMGIDMASEMAEYERNQANTLGQDTSIYDQEVNITVGPETDFMYQFEFDFFGFFKFATYWGPTTGFYLATIASVIALINFCLVCIIPGSKKAILTED
jgi:hypothetical protein